jgi:hypothetical protein
MYPLMVERGICKLIDLLLRDLDIVRYTQLFASVALKFLVTANDQWVHGHQISLLK